MALGLVACKKDDIQKDEITSKVIEKTFPNILITEKVSNGVADSSVVDGDNPPKKEKEHWKQGN